MIQSFPGQENQDLYCLFRHLYSMLHDNISPIGIGWGKSFHEPPFGLFNP